jgi:hypothetical protein
MIWLINPYTLYLVYAAYASLNAARKSNTLSKPALYLGYYPVFIVGALLDITVNVTWGTLAFLDIPKELMLTKRVERLKSVSGWRGKLALLVCQQLNALEDGHCK